MVTTTILDVNVEVLDFHSNSANEMIVPNADGTYTVLINARSAYNKQIEAFKHALQHIKNMDFFRNDVQKIETKAHNNEVER